MAEVRVVEFDHAIYEPFSYVRGAELDVAKSDLDRLLTPADRALGRSDGFFFDTFDGQFVLGFEQNRTDRHSRNESEGYFDLFVGPVEEVEKVKLDELQYHLRREKAESFTADVDGSVTVEVEARAGDGGEHTAEGDFDFGEGDSPDGADGEWIDERKIAEMWEHLRRDSVQLYRQLWEVDEFVDAVDGALEHISFVSEERNPVSYFDVIDGASEDGREATDAEYGALENLVGTLRAEGRLAWDELPTYRDELDELRERHREALSYPTAYFEAVDAVFEDLADGVRKDVRDHAADAASLYDEALEGTLRAEEDDEGLLRRLVSIIWRGSKLLSVPFAWLLVAYLAAVIATGFQLQTSLLVSASVLAAAAVSGSVVPFASVARRGSEAPDAAWLLSIPFVWLGTALLIALTAEEIATRFQLIAVAALLATIVLVAAVAVPAVTDIPGRFRWDGLKLVSISVVWFVATATLVVATLVLSAAVAGLATAAAVAVAVASVLWLASRSGGDDREVGPFVQHTADLAVDPEVVVAVNEEMQANVEAFLADVRDDLEKDFEETLASTIEVQSGELARQVVEAVSEARTSVPYDQVHGED